MGHVNNYIFELYLFIESGCEMPLSDDISDSPSEYDEI